MLNWIVLKAIRIGKTDGMNDSLISVDTILTKDDLLFIKSKWSGIER